MPTQTAKTTGSNHPAKTGRVQRCSDPDLAQARLDFLSGERLVRGRVRSPILASWLRSAEYDVPATRVSPLLVEDPELDTPLTRTAAPVLASLAEALADQSIGIILADQRGLVLTRQVADASFGRRLDTLSLTPGFVHAERYVGTNGIGTALEIGGPVHVVGHEHYAERLEDLACAAAPIHHPITGRTVGVLDLTSRPGDGGSLLLALALTTAAQIEADLLSTTGPATRRLVDEYMRACHRSSSLVLAVGHEIAMMNDRARALLTSADQSVLMRHGAEAFRCGRPTPVDLGLDRGVTARVTCHLVQHAGGVDGIVLRVRLLTPSMDEQRGDPPGRVRQLPGLIGVSPIWTQACHRVEQAYTVGTWSTVVGEAGVGKLSLLRAVQLRRQPISRLTVLDCSRAGEPGWQARLSQPLQRAGESLVLHHIDALGASQLRAVVEELRLARRDGDGPWVAITLTEAGGVERLRPLLALFPVTVEIPPLRLHPEDIGPLVTHFLARLGDGAPPTCSADALAMLTRAAWPGNAAQLFGLVGQVLGRRRCGVIECDDLPPAAHSVSRRQLSHLESLERDAIVRALQECRGDKLVAATGLGMSRATIYRRLKAYGIAD